MFVSYNIVSLKKKERVSDDTKIMWMEMGGLVGINIL
jgi:hypothetical protein